MQYMELKESFLLLHKMFTGIFLCIFEKVFEKKP